MVFKIPTHHCSDYELLAYAERELPFWRRWLIRSHIHRCWHCRARLQERDGILLEIANHMSQWSLEDWSAILVARQRFRQRLNAEVGHEISAVPSPTRRRMVLGAAGVASCAALGTIAFLRRSSPDLWQRAILSEQTALAAPAIRQTMYLQISSNNVNPRHSTLELIRDRKMDRLALEWRSEEGELLFGLWRRGAKEEFVYAAHEGIGIRKSRLTHERDESTFAQGDFSQSFISAWLERRERKAIRISQETPILDGELGESPAVIRQDAGVRLCWKQPYKHANASVVVLLNQQSYQPEIQVARFAQKGDEIEIRLKDISLEPLDESALVPRMFMPTPQFILSRGPSSSQTSVNPS